MVNRVLKLLIGTCCISFGIAFMSKASIGMSPISCFPYVMSLIYTNLTLGNWVLIWNVLFALLQIPIMGKQYKLYLLTQIPLAFLLGYCTDLVKYLIQGVSVNSYAISVALVILGTALTALGVYLTVNAKLIMNGPEAFVRAVSDKTNAKFGTLKSAFDISNTILAIVSSLVIFHRLYGVREGTIFSAIFTGLLVNVYTKLVDSVHKHLQSNQ